MIRNLTRSAMLRFDTVTVWGAVNIVGLDSAPGRAWGRVRESSA